MSKRTSFLLERNSVQPGLNFLVPNDWWNEFLEINKLISEWGQLNISRQLPLDGLTQMGLVQVPAWISQASLKNLKAKAENAAIKITKDIEVARNGIFKNCTSERLKESFDVLNFEKIQETEMTVLVCAQVNTNLLKELLFDTFQWRVVTPEIYKNICLKGKRSQGKEFLGVAVFLDESTNLQNPNDMTYDLGPQVDGEIYIYNSEGAKYCIVGSFEQKLCYEEIMRHLYQGINNFMDREKLNDSYFFKRSCFVTNNSQVFQNFLIGQNKQDKAFRQEFNWKNWLQSQGEKIASQKFQIFQFGGHAKQKQITFKRLNESRQKFSNMSPSKKLKKDDSVSAQYAELTNSKGFQPTIIQDIFNLLGNRQQSIELFKKRSKSVIEIHSTEGKFSSPKQSKKISLTDQNRLCYSLWKGEKDVTSLRKLAESKMNDIIPVPFSDNFGTNKKNFNQNKVQLNSQCNKITTNDKGQITQQESIKQKQQNAGAIETTKFLDDLAQQILGKKYIVPHNHIESEPESQEQTKEVINTEKPTLVKASFDKIDEAQRQQC